MDAAPRNKPILVWPPTWNTYPFAIAVWDDDKWSTRPRPYWRRSDDHGRKTESRGKPPEAWADPPLPPSPSSTRKA
jgi:hypothetical protein